MKRIFAGLVASMVAATAAAQTVRIGVIGTYSGPQAVFGEMTDRAFKLYTKLHEKDLPAGMNTIKASGFASLTRCRYGAKSGFCSGTRTDPTISPPPALKPCVKAVSASWPGA